MHSLASWPPESYEAAVEEAIRDELAEAGVVISAQFMLSEIGWQEVESCASAFNLTTREAVRHVVDGNVDRERRDVS